MKERIDVIASSLSSYFGVGFLTPQEQLDIDLGNEERIIDEESQDRMNLGNYMEDACLNYFENKFGIIIDERNSEYGYAFNNQLKCKRDGRTIWEGVETGVENKYSNSSSKNFVDDKGYELQCQAYMKAWDLDQWLLLGMWQGKPYHKLIKRDEEIINDIETVVEAVSNILMGISDIDEYPWDIVEKYSATKQLLQLEDLDDDDHSILKELATTKKEHKKLDARIKELESYIKENFEDFKYKDDNYSYAVSSYSGRKSFDKQSASIENPTIDFEKYMKEGNPYRTIRITPIKK